MKPGLHLDYDIADLVGAKYNPRKIDSTAIDKLKHSLGVIGCAKPIIARGQTIVAGHQRTRALRAMGRTTAPVYLLPADANVYDEVRFNQLHNGTDMDTGDERVRISMDLAGRAGFVSVPAGQITGNVRAKGANIRNEILKLIASYGPWGACCANEAGEVFHAAQYALACIILHKPCLVYVIPRAIEAEARELLGATYGVFSYDRLPRNTFIQTFAQLMRLRGETGALRENSSPTYDRHIIPWMQANPTARVLDFGCGQGDYVKALGAKGHRIIGLEFFRRLPATESIDVKAVNLMVDRLIESLGNYGLFDAVVCDYVLNSVDSQQAEDDVVTCLSALCKPGGRIFFSGRTKERIEWQDTMSKSFHTHKDVRYIEFLDEHGITALYRKGEWFYQKFHSKADIAALCKKYGFTLASESKTSCAFQLSVVSSGPRPLPEVIAAIDREFNMPLNKDGRRLGRHEDMKNALLPCLTSNSTPSAPA